MADPESFLFVHAKKFPLILTKKTVLIAGV
jgi:hypothetical protein